MLISGEASFSAIRDERPRVRERSKTDVSHSPTKENQPYVANVRDIRAPVADRNDDLQADGSVYSAYDEYNNRPASTAVPRVRARRSSVVGSPRPFSPSIESDGPGIVRRGRSQSVISPPSCSRFEREMDSESVYLNVSDDFSKCLDVTPEVPEDTVNFVSLLEKSSSSGGSPALQPQERVTELQLSLGSDRTGSDVLSEILFDLPDLTLLSQQEIQGVVKIQAAWRGYRSRKEHRNLIMTLAAQRYQRHYSVMTEQISQLTSDLNRERQLSSLYREMLYKMAGMLKEQKPVTRSRLTQTKRVQMSDHHTQTQGLISTLLASFAVDTPHQSVQEQSSGESDIDTSGDDSTSSCNPDEVSNQRCSGNKNSSKCATGDGIQHSSDVFISSSSGDNDNTSNVSNGEFKSGSSNGFTCSPQYSREPSNSGTALKKTSNSHASKYAELKEQFESPDHLAKINKTVPAANIGTSTEVTASFIRNSIDTLRNSLSLNRNSPSKQEPSPNNLNSLSCSNGHEALQDSDFMLNQFKPAEDIRNEPTS